MLHAETRDPRAAEQMRDVCHEMRQPVAGLLALTAAALAEPGLPQSAQTRLEQITLQAELLGDIIRHWLADAHADAPAADETDLVRSVNAVAAAERLTWPGEITVAWSEPARAAVHPALVRRVLTNVLSNAIRAARRDGSVTIEVGRSRGWATVAIEDSGPGFGRIEAGSGLGFPAAARIVAKCGGRLECGGAAGGGVRVTIRLPLASGDADANPANVA